MFQYYGEAGSITSAYIALTDENRQQLSLMDTPQTEEERQRSQKLMATMYALNEKMGKGTVRLGVPGKTPLAPTLREPKPALYHELE